MNEPPSAFFDFPQQAFPVMISVVDEQTRELVWHVEVSGPGALNVPSFAPRKVCVLISEAGGEASLTDSSGCTVALRAPGPDGDQHG
jgi:hypothetical protein